MPVELEIPEGLEYRYMITALAKYYCISPKQAEGLSELDFWVMYEFNLLEEAKMNYRMKTMNNE